MVLQVGILVLKIYYEDNHLLVLEKPINVPMQKDSSNDLDLLTMASIYLKEKYHKPGKVYVGLVQRLDRPVSGVCVLAKTSKAASRLSDSIRKKEFKKKYLAVVIDNDLKDEGHFEDKLLKDNKTNTSSVDPNGKLSILDYEVLKRVEGLALVSINLETGRSHQIRVQFASRNCPLWGDQRYNPSALKGQQIALHCQEISFPHPISKEIITFNSPIDTYPFNL